MNKQVFLIVLFMFFLIGGAAHAQECPDILKLENGSRVEGRVELLDPVDGATIVTKRGARLHYDITEVKDVRWGRDRKQCGPIASWEMTFVYSLPTQRASYLFDFNFNIKGGWFIGAGFGGLTEEIPVTNEINNFTSERTITSIPIYVTTKFYPLRGIIQPYLGASLGWSSVSDDEKSLIDSKSDFFWRGEIGIAFRLIKGVLLSASAGRMSTRADGLSGTFIYSFGATLRF